jgi:outer membrane protein assembly factor BamB
MFRGPDRTDVSPDTGLLKAWPKGGPPLAWKAVGIGIGYSSVSVVGDQVFTMGDRDDGCYLFAFGRARGEKLWQLKLGAAGGGGGYKGPRCTPSTDGERVYALTPNGDLVCAEAKYGTQKWAKNLKKDFGGSSGGWSYSESPLVDGDRLIVTPGGGKATMAALDKTTGATVWSGLVPKGDTAGYSSVVVAHAGGVKQYVTLMANGLVSFAAADGKLLWRYGTDRDRFGGNTANIPTPIVKGDQVFASAGYGRGAALVKVARTGADFSVEEVYWKKELTNKHGGVILVGDKLYGDRDDGGNPWCAEFETGKVLWARKGGGEGRGSASMTYADGRLYVRYSNGWVALVDATADGYTELGAFKVPNGKNDTWAHPVVTDGRLFVRELNTLWVYDVRAKK